MTRRAHFETFLISVLLIVIVQVSGTANADARNAQDMAFPADNVNWSAAESFTSSSLVYGWDPAIDTDTSGNWIAVYTTSGTATNSDRDIAFVRSTDGGRNWSSPQFLNSDWNSDGLADGSPMISASDSYVWLCVWVRSFNEVWMARSYDLGVSWTSPAPVHTGNNVAVLGKSPQVGALGFHQWILAWDDNGIYTSRSGDNGLHWTEPVLAQSDYELGRCGNSSRCSQHFVSEPRVFCEPANSKVFIGFTHYWSDLPGGYSGLSYNTRSSDAQPSLDGGQTFPDNTGYDTLRGPIFTGTNEMATDGRENWLAARHTFESFTYDPSIWSQSFGVSHDNGETFTYEDVPVIEGYHYAWGKVAMTHTGKWLRLWAGKNSALETEVFVSESPDEGESWTVPTHLNTDTASGANSPVDLNVKGGIDGNFVAVWEAELPGGESTIWFARQNLYEEAGADDWELFD